MIDSDFSQFFKGHSLARLEQIYLQTNFDFLRESSFRENSLNLGHDRAGHHAAFWSDSVYLLPYPRHHCEILWEILSQYSSDTTQRNIFHLWQIWKVESAMKRNVFWDCVYASPSASKLSWSTSFRISSVASTVCSFHDSPLSERSMTISRSLPRRAAKCGTSIITGLEGKKSNLAQSESVITYPRNLAPTGPNSKMRLAKASPSIRGGGCGVRWGRT